MEKKSKKLTSAQLPSLATGSTDSLKRYIQMVQNLPYLTVEEELAHAKALKENKSREAAEILVSSHLRLVVKVAYDFRHYGLPLGDLISEGNIGLMTAVKKFDPDKGFRLTTYALWWIKAMIQDYILSSWSLVKIGSASVQKKLFFGLKRTKEKLGVYDDRELTMDNAKAIAKELDVPEDAVYNMNARLSGDFSLNQRANDDSKSEYMDFLTSSEPPQDILYEEKEIKQQQRVLLAKGMAQLSERERDILTARQLNSDKSLKDLGIEFNISAERVRQIENKAFKKLKTYILEYDNKPLLADKRKKKHD
ncbi:MAG: RNA polymerase factor sigma-32 [Alphaproteobacteria bacterium]|nr:RNA polymerase factor sigma-32 [Alphaproteobacteria bacterium]MBN2779535.1 RNA polymerase factor sigma-32 [Alphaproteobacteria bacterium]